ncbi:hypothetical protein [Pseudomonas saponiphila]|uniref:hypothetical protein n=1 Tax=Pseudomonas saponiphila TaxID=556534 RepID=UPI00223FD9BD|nr:hypothetical protein [Pseudomonas saponiphila]
MAATGGFSNRVYRVEDIFDQTLYPRMREEPLLNEADELVIPVRKTGRPHFRRIGRASFGARLGRGENDPTHNQCVSLLHENLSSYKINRISISVYVFDDRGQYEEQVIFSTLAGTDYRWFMESTARVGFHDDRYIQPDLSGRDANKFFPTSSSPNVIIEVIRTHIPEETTFARLQELSKANTLVAFYFINERAEGSKINNFRVEDDHLTIRVSRYMVGGEAYVNGTPVFAQRPGETFSHWYGFLTNSFFADGMKQAK